MNDLSKQNMSKWLAIGMIVCNIFLIICVMGIKSSPPWIPFFTPFGMQLGIVTMIFLLWYCYYFNLTKGFWWILSIWIIISPFYFVGEFFLHERSLHGIARIVLGNSCFSALVIGISVLRGKL